MICIPINKIMEGVTRGVHKNFPKMTGKHLCRGLFIDKTPGIYRATLLKERLRHSCLPVNFAKSLRTLILYNASGRLFLKK